MSASATFSPRLVGGIILVGILTFGAMMLAIAFDGGEAGSAGDGRSHALSVSATGYKGLYDLVERTRGARLVRDEAGLATDDLLIVALEPRSRAEDVQRLVDARRGPTLFILPKWVTVASDENSGWVRILSPGAGAAGLQALGGGLERRSGGPGAGSGVAGQGLVSGIRFAVPDSPQAVDGKRAVTLVPLADDAALVAQLLGEPHYLVADPDLLANHALDDMERARTAIALIDALSPTRGPVAFDLTVNGFGRTSSPTLLRLAFEPPFIAMTLALLVAGILAGLHGANRFGPVARELRAFAFGKADLVENSAGLVRLARREARLGPAYADVIRQEAARALHAPAGLEGEALDAWIDRAARRPAAEPARGRLLTLRSLPTAPAAAPFSELARNVETARDRHQLLAAARTLSSWRGRVTK